MNAIATLPKTEEYGAFDEIEKLVRDFESATLPHSRWTHRAHLTVACWYLICYPEAEAARRIREGINKLNNAHGVVTARDRGYHETITMFWIRMIRSYLVRSTLECPLTVLINDITDWCGNRQLPFRYYSRERLMSWEARIGWVEPDLKSLP